MTTSPLPPPGDPGGPVLPVAQIRVAVELARDAVAGVREVLWQAAGSDLGDVLGELGELALTVDAAEVAVLVEVLTRGEHRTGEWPLSPADWVAAHSRRYPTSATASRLARVAAGIAAPTTSRDHIPTRLAEPVLTGQAPVAAAAVAATEMTRLTPDLQPGFVPAAWEAYADLAAHGDLTEIRRLRPALIARYGRPDDLDKEHTHAKDRATLSRGASDGGALTDYRLGLDPESVAILESALDPLTTPVPGPDGEPDTRPWTTRRAHALIDLIARAVKADTDGVIGRSSTHTTLLIALRDLTDPGPAHPAGPTPRTSANPPWSPVPGSARPERPADGAVPAPTTHDQDQHQDQHQDQNQHQAQEQDQDHNPADAQAPAPTDGCTPIPATDAERSQLKDAGKDTERTSDTRGSVSPEPPWPDHAGRAPERPPAADTADSADGEPPTADTAGDARGEPPTPDHAGGAGGKPPTPNHAGGTGGKPPTPTLAGRAGEEPPAPNHADRAGEDSSTPDSAGGAFRGPPTAGTGTAIGTIDAGRFLSPAITRSLTCDTAITPVVIDDHGNPLAVGRTHRLFSPAQVQALIVRDGGCTFPGCTRPAGWTDAHHLIHWADGGRTTLENAALLCRLHHTTVHSRHLSGRLTTGPPDAADHHRQRVTWDLSPGSYPAALAEYREHQRARGDPDAA